MSKMAITVSVLQAENDEIAHESFKLLAIQGPL